MFSKSYKPPRTLKTLFEQEEPCAGESNVKIKYSHRFNKENVGKAVDTIISESRVSLQSSNTKSLTTSFKKRGVAKDNPPFQIEDFFKRVSNYLTISNVLIEEAETVGDTSGTLLRQIKKLGDRI